MPPHNLKADVTVEGKSYAINQENKRQLGITSFETSPDLVTMDLHGDKIVITKTSPRKTVNSWVRKVPGGIEYMENMYYPEVTELFKNMGQFAQAYPDFYKTIKTHLDALDDYAKTNELSNANTELLRSANRDFRLPEVVKG